MSVSEQDLDAFETRLKDVFDSMRTMLVKKRRSYGTGNLTRFGLLGILVRTSDKVERLATMIQNGTEASADGDSMRDAWRDIIGYAVLALLFMDDHGAAEMAEKSEPEETSPWKLNLGSVVVTTDDDGYVGKITAINQVTGQMIFQPHDTSMHSWTVGPNDVEPIEVAREKAEAYWARMQK